MSVKFDDFLQEQLRDPEFRKEYEALQPEHAIIQAIIDARRQSGMTQKELAEKTGIAQGDISKLERGKCKSVYPDIAAVGCRDGNDDQAGVSASSGKGGCTEKSLRNNSGCI